MTDPLAKFTRIPISEITATPNGLVMAYKDYWWIVTPDEEVLQFRGTSMQCNLNRVICERHKPEGCTVRQLPIAFIKVSPSDFA